MIEFHYWPTPNGWKAAIMLEECGLPYELKKVHIGEGDQFKPEFLKLSPNNRIPAILDRDAPGGPLGIFESGAILMYLAEKSGKFLPMELHKRYDVLQWLYWQVGGLGPMAGQLGHFRNYTKEKIAYPIQRYSDEYNRLLGVLERGLQDRNFIAGEYTIADMAIWPWVRSHERLGQPLDEFPNIARWFDRIWDRPAVQRGFAVGSEWYDPAKLKPGSEKESQRNKNLFGHTAKVIDKMTKNAELKK